MAVGPALSLRILHDEVAELRTAPVTLMHGATSLDESGNASADVVNIVALLPSEVGLHESLVSRVFYAAFPGYERLAHGFVERPRGGPTPPSARPSRSRPRRR